MPSLHQLAIETKVDPDFLKACLDASGYSALIFLSPDERVANKMMSRINDEEHRISNLVADYPAAITDFHGCGVPCVYKSGPAWPVSNHAKLRRAARPVYNHDIAPVWVDTAWKIVAELDSLQVKWNTVDPLAYANRGEAALICDFVVSISVWPGSLAFQAAVAAAGAVNKILEAAGFPEIEVAFVESIYRRQGKLMGFDILNDTEGIPGLRKPFTPTLGLAVAPKTSPHYEGTGGLFMRLNSDESDERIVLLTCAHVVHPPPLFANKAYTRDFGTQPREDIILLGSGANDDALTAIMQFIGKQANAIDSWERRLSGIPEETQGEHPATTTRRKELTVLIAAAKTKMTAAKDLFSYVTENFFMFASRMLGFVLHCAKMEVDSAGYMSDWAFIQLDNRKLEMEHFKGNKLFLGGNKTEEDWRNYMFPQEHDRRGFSILDDQLLPIKDYLPEAEFRNPQDCDVHNTQTLLAVKNSRTTGTTFGRVNGLESITRHSDRGLELKALEFIVCSYDTETGGDHQFSNNGDSGSVVVGRDGRVIGLLTGGGGPVASTDKSYITPFYRVKKEIEKKYPNASLLAADA